MRSILVYFKLLAIILIAGLLPGCEDTIESPLTGTLTGRVLAKSTMTPLGNVRISTNPYSDVTETDSLGHFVMKEIETGEYNIISTKNGYRSESITATVDFSEETDVEFVLEESIKNDENPVFTGNFTPGDNEVLEELKVNFSWEILNDDSLAFELMLFENGNISDPLIYENIEDTFLIVTGLKYNTEYFWQLAAGTGEEKVYTSVRSFSTLPMPSNRILYSKMTDNVMQLFVNDSTTENSTQITFEKHHIWNGSINSQRTLFAFQSTRDVDPHLYLMNIDGADVTRLTSFPVGSFFHRKIEYDWVPDGSQIIFSSYEFLYRINVDGTGLQTFAQAPVG
jgi:TolB protein